MVRSGPAQLPHLTLTAPGLRAADATTVKNQGIRSQCPVLVGKGAPQLRFHDDGVGRRSDPESIGDSHHVSIDGESW